MTLNDLIAAAHKIKALRKPACAAVVLSYPDHGHLERDCAELAVSQSTGALGGRSLESFMSLACFKHPYVPRGHCISAGTLEQAHEVLRALDKVQAAGMPWQLAVLEARATQVNLEGDQ